MGMSREADMIEQQIKMRGSTPGQPAGKWCVSALSELVPHFLKMPFKTKILRLWLLCCCRNCRPMHKILFLHQNKKTATIFFFLFFSFLYFYIYLPYWTIIKKITCSFLCLYWICISKWYFPLKICVWLCCEFVPKFLHNEKSSTIKKHSKWARWASKCSRSSGCCSSSNSGRTRTSWLQCTMGWILSTNGKEWRSRSYWKANGNAKGI